MSSITLALKSLNGVYQQMSKKKVNFDTPLIEEFIEAKKSEKRPITLNRYRYALYEFDRRLIEGGKALSDILVEDLSAFVLEMQEKSLSSSTILVKMWAVKGFAKWLWYRDLLDEKKYKAFEEYWPDLPKNKDDRRALEPSEEKHIMRNLGNQMFRMMFWVGCNYGLRCSEYATLKVRNIYLEKQKLTIHGKGNKHRTVGIPKAHIQNWEDCLTTREAYHLPHDHVFFSSNGQPTHRTIQRYFNKMSEQAYPMPEGLSKAEITQFKKDPWFTPHILRFTFATKLHRGGMPILDISKALGHSNINTTQNYLRIKEEEAHESYLDKAEKILVA
jgi:site-specific recombinase XerD